MKLLLAVLTVVVMALAGAASRTPPVYLSHDVPAELPPAERTRIMLYRELQPVRLSGCELERFGEPTDGGYLMCRELMRHSQVAYSYGISGYDGWGCAVAGRIASITHQYDCFNLTEPACDLGRTYFHPLCVAGREATDSDGRVFESLTKQIADNGDRFRRIVMKMDVEGAEWDTLLRTPDEVLRRIDQLAIEMHGVDQERYLTVVRKLKRTFHVANLHVNNYSCGDKYRPFPGWAYEVLFVNKRLARRIDGAAPIPHPLDAPNNPDAPDCATRRDP